MIYWIKLAIRLPESLLTTIRTDLSSLWAQMKPDFYDKDTVYPHPAIDELGRWELPELLSEQFRSRKNEREQGN